MQKTSRIEIENCIQCRWLLRAAWIAQELLTTFSTVIGEIALVPGAGGVFTIRIGEKELRCSWRWNPISWKSTQRKNRRIDTPDSAPPASPDVYTLEVGPVIALSHLLSTRGGYSPCYADDLLKLEHTACQVCGARIHRLAMRSIRGDLARPIRRILIGTSGHG
jgi:selT/selW/selH-like putative selenoprotein